MATEYKTVTGKLYDVTDQPSISSLVNAHLKMGWIPQGGICESSAGYFVQAMIKEK